MPETVFERLESWLTRSGVEFTILRHAPVFTSAEAAAVRGTPLASGAKALICKADADVVMFVLPADRRLASKSARAHGNWKSIRFATREEVYSLTGLEPGSIPPFGSLFGLRTLVDRRLGENERINFNAGDHSISVSMPHAEFLRVESPQLGDFAE